MHQLASASATVAARRNSSGVSPYLARNLFRIVAVEAKPEACATASSRIPRARQQATGPVETAVGDHLGQRRGTAGENPIEVPATHMQVPRHDLDTEIRVAEITLDEVGDRGAQIPLTRSQVRHSDTGNLFATRNMFRRNVHHLPVTTIGTWAHLVPSTRVLPPGNRHYRQGGSRSWAFGPNSMGLRLGIVLRHANFPYPLRSGTGSAVHLREQSDPR